MAPQRSPGSVFLQACMILVAAGSKCNATSKADSVRIQKLSLAPYFSLDALDRKKEAVME